MTAAWEALPEALLRCEVARRRVARAAPPDPFAGLQLTEADVDRLVAGDEGGTAPAALVKAVDAARAGFGRAVAGSQLGEVIDHARLDRAEAEVLALLAAVELDPRRQRLVAYLQDDVTRTRPTLHLLGRLFGPGAVGAAAADGRLRRAALLEVAGGGPWASQPVVLAPAVAWALAGDGSLEPDLPPGTWVVGGESRAGDDLVFVSGDDRVRRIQAAVEATARTSFLVVPEPTTEEQWRAAVRTASLTGAGIILEVGRTLTAEARHWIERADHVGWAIASAGELALEEMPRRPWREVQAPAPPATDDEVRAALGDVDRQGHRLSAEQLRLVRTAVLSGSDVDAGIRRLASGPFDRLAIRVRPQRTWDDLVLATDRIQMLRELTSRYRHRGIVHGEWGFPAIPAAGLVAMFSGPSGTGKTLAAEIIAGDLGLDLFKLDLSSVVSKYIGETEKNLERVFSAATSTNTVLFFDEADSLFGKRSEVTDARDRYANLEVSYLLQRLEAYDGLVILATNFSKNLDEAFLRRIHVSIEFPVPQEPERRAIWAHALPATAPTKDIDLDFLARQFDLSGGSIKGAALHAAFLAAEDGVPITMEHLMLALKREFQKLGRLRTQNEFAQYTKLVNS
ncbi:MAG TPA: ATP-binding protein [Acidimicrobiales bacterium]|nr:ATP-binding protein [Acidimicrobiales bacterium]